MSHEDRRIEFVCHEHLLLQSVKSEYSADIDYPRDWESSYKLVIQ